MLAMAMHARRDGQERFAEANGLYRHPTLWLDDGDLVLIVDNCGFKLHQKFIDDWRSPAMSRSQVRHDVALAEFAQEGCQVVYIAPEMIPVQPKDVEALLEHLYGRDNPISVKSPFPQVAAILRASSPQQLDIPKIHALCLEVVEKMFPSGPQPFVHPDFLHEALELSQLYRIPSIQKGLYYSLVTTSNFDIGETVRSTAEMTSQRSYPANESTPGDTTTSTSPHSRLRLSAADAQRCTQLMHNIIDHFTPILFTLATASHIACTDIFAEKWMDLVIQPAIENDDVYKPLETLQRIMEIDWAVEGLCGDCVRDKRAEWQEEQWIVWSKLDGWLGLQGDQAMA